MGVTRYLTGIAMAAALALLGAGPAFANGPDETIEPFVRGMQVHQPGDQPHYTGRETAESISIEEPFVQGAPIYQPGYTVHYAAGDTPAGRVQTGGAPLAVHASAGASVYDMPVLRYTLQRPWSEVEEALGVGK